MPDLDYQIIKSTVLQYLKHVGCRRTEIIQLFVSERLHGRFDAEVLLALGELVDQGALITVDGAVYCYLSRAERARRARAERR